MLLPFAVRPSLRIQFTAILGARTMIIDIDVHLDYFLPETADILLQIEVPALPDQTVLREQIKTPDLAHFSRIIAEAGMGERIWMRHQGNFQFDYSARIEIDRPVHELSRLASFPPHLLPGDTVNYLLPSRFCPSDLYQNWVVDEFGSTQGGERVAAIRDWVNRSIDYVPGASNVHTSAMDTLWQRQGVCRDFAHVVITLARASTIPARFVSVYAPGVTPQDFHAVAEVYLQDGWHLVDATGMAPAETIARIGVGADAAGVAFLTVFGQMDFVEQSVAVTQVLPQEEVALQPVAQSL